MKEKRLRTVDLVEGDDVAIAHGFSQPYRSFQVGYRLGVSPLVDRAEAPGMLDEELLPTSEISRTEAFGLLEGSFHGRELAPLGVKDRQVGVDRG